MSKTSSKSKSSATSASLIREGKNWACIMLEELCRENKLNFYKVLCLHWQAKTNKKCTNRKHKEGIYADKLECEAALTEMLVFHFQFPTRKSAEALREHIIKQI